jgi:uncharacterized membrane protein
LFSLIVTRMDFLGGTNGYVILKSLHVIAAVTWVGGALGQNILAARLLKTKSGPVMANFAREAEWVGMHVYLPSSLVLLGLGIWMVATEAWNFTDLWVELGILGIVLTVITGAFVIGPTAKKVGELIEAKGPDDPQIQTQIAKLLKVARVDLVVLFLVVVDMVAKPVL